MVSYHRNKVDEAKRKLDLGLRVYDGKKVTDQVQSEIIEIMGNCIKDLSWDEYCVLKQDSPEYMINFLDLARAKVKQDYYNQQASQAGSSLPDLPKEETDEEKQERLHREQVNFFFPKNKSVPQCDCGAAYTQFPNIHMHYCKVKKSESTTTIRNTQFWD